MKLYGFKSGVVGVACAMVVGMGASPAWAQVIRQSPGDFSPEATQVTLELELGSTFSDPIESLLEFLGVVFEVSFATDAASVCPGQVDVIAGQARPPFTNEIQIRFVDPASGAPSVIAAFGTFIGSLISGGGSGEPPAGTISEVTLTAFDINGNPVGSVVTSPGSPDRNPTFPLGDFLGARFDGGIHRVVLTNDPSTDLFVMGDFFVTGSPCNFGFDFVFEPDGCPQDPNKVDPGVCGCGVPDADSDGDLLADCVDACPDSDLEDTIIINGDDTGVENELLGDGCSLADLIAEVLVNDPTTGDIVQMLVDLKAMGLLSGQEMGAMLQALNSP